MSFVSASASTEEVNVVAVLKVSFRIRKLCQVAAGVKARAVVRYVEVGGSCK